MNKTTQIVIAIVAVIALVGSYFYPQNTNTTIDRVTAVSTAGVTNSTAKIATIVISPVSTSATSSYIYNADGTDREIESLFAACTGLNTDTDQRDTSFTLSAATTSVTGKGLNGNANKSSVTVATSTTYGYAIDTSSTFVAVDRIWASGTYLALNWAATTTAACTSGVHYLSL